MNIFTKQPHEQIPFTMDFGNLLNDTETISTAEVFIYDPTNTDVTTTIKSRLSIVGDTIRVTVKAGTDGKRYKITIFATSSEGNIYEEDVFMNVYEV